MEFPDGAVVRFKSVVTDKYVHPIDKYRPLKGYLSADHGEGVPIPNMCLEKASKGSGWYHIKSRDTNKYWQVKLAPSESSWITADADEKNEDEGMLACTMFHMELFTPGTGSTTTIRLQHCNLKRYVRLYKAFGDPKSYDCLCAYSENIDKDSMDVFVYSKS